jgi:chemotaxis protein methyltransferase CheR
MRPHPTELLSHEQFEALREAIERTSGIVLGAGKLSHLDSVVRERMALSGDRSVAAYLDRVIADSSPDGERKALVTALLVGETSFFRTPALYDILQRKLLPEMASAPSAFPIRIWSAGCATGEEPYSVAISALHAFEGRVAEPVRILATDLHAGFLDVAREGIYPASALRGAPPLLVMKYFRRLPDGRLKVSDEVRRLVTFEQRNLSEAPWPGDGPGDDRFAAILCRNVMIYFRSETTRQVVAAFHGRLADRGLLFLGHSETLWGISDAFRLEESDGYFYYRKKDPLEVGLPDGPVPRPAVRRRAAAAARPRVSIPAGAPVAVPAPPAPPAPPVSPSPPPPPAAGPAADAVALALAQQAEKLLDADRLPEAEAACLKAIAMFPGCVEAEYLLAVLMRRNGRCDGALVHAARALLIDPLFVQAAVEIAESLAIQGKRVESDEYWRGVLRMLERPVHFPRLSPATGMTASGLRDYVAARFR